MATISQSTDQWDRRLGKRWGWALVFAILVTIAIFFGMRAEKNGPSPAPSDAMPVPAMPTTPPNGR